MSQGRDVDALYRAYTRVAPLYTNLAEDNVEIASISPDAIFLDMEGRISQLPGTMI